ncbi:MAG: FG-GAP repeat protein [Thermoanaerobaculia bacterium]|nr:FG-GAP repeat protein [Thermoanaerobaculia bacterium]MBP9825755.1 FG-GAP repeat protein [Thermoanaerobaculia bacterium]
MLAVELSGQDLNVGLSPVRSHRLANVTIGDLGPQTNDRFAQALAAGDLDGDGFDDLAVGIPQDDGPLAAPVANSGGVSVYFGAGDTGIAGAPPRRIAQSGSGYEVNDRHGHALAICDFDGDGFADLAVGAPGEGLGAIDAAGAVFVYPGDAGGPVVGAFALFTQATVGIADTAEAGDAFGAALACGDFDNDGFADLAIGAPSEDVGAAVNAGWVAVLRGSAAGLSATGTHTFTQGGPDVADDPEPNDQFGASLAAGDFDGDGFADLAIGVPGEELSAGAVHVLFGALAGLTGFESLDFTDATLGGLTEAGDNFGLTLAFGDLDGDGFHDLVVGIPLETFASSGGPIVETGQVAVVRGSVTPPGPVSYWAENNIHFPGASEGNDRFGLALAVADFNGDGRADFAAGHSGEAIGFAQDGAVTVMVGTADGPAPTAGRRLFAAGADGFPGPPPPGSPGRELGRALAAGDFDGDGYADLAIGAPHETIEGVTGAGTVTVLPGAQFADGFEHEVPLAPWAIDP